MELTDPHEGKTYTLRTVAQDGEVRETEITPAQVLDLGAGKPIFYTVRDERITVDDDGTITTHESAVPQRPDAA